MTPMEFMGRLAILVPPPYYPTVRYSGVFAARSSWRKRVTPKPPDGVARPKRNKPCPDPTDNASAPSANTVPASAPPASPAGDASAPKPSAKTEALVPPPSPLVSQAFVPPVNASSNEPTAAIAFDNPTSITVEHWHRLLEGELFATSSRVEWAILLRRTHGFDALRCPRCEAKMRIIATITEPMTVRKILTHLGVRAEPLPRARARDPTGQERFDFHAA